MTHMKEKLKKIYHDLSQGRLTKSDALDKIRQIKNNQQLASVSSLFAGRVWQQKPIDDDKIWTSSEIAKHVFVIDMPNVLSSSLDNLLEQTTCFSFQGDYESIAENYKQVALKCFDSIKAILRQKNKGKILFQIVLPDSNEKSLYAGLLGLVKTANLENPEFIGQIILCNPALDSDSLAKRLVVEAKHIEDSMVRYIEEQRHVFTWKEIAFSSKKIANTIKEQGVYLITGGLGGLGVLFAKEILRSSGRATVILTGRSEITSDKQTILNGLVTASTKIEYKQLDLENYQQVESLLKEVVNKYQKINGILHCAGMLSDNFIIKKSSTEFENVLTPKVVGCYHLDQASKHLELDFFALFSSLASSLGNIGQADYASANAFMDFYASYRNGLVKESERSGKTISFNWPLWLEGGMQIEESNLENHKKKTGIVPLRTSTAMDAFHRSLLLEYDEVLIVEGEIEKIRKSLLSSQIRATQLSETNKFQDSIQNYEELPISSGEKSSSKILVEKTQILITQEFSQFLKLLTHQVDIKAPLEKYGIDSIMAMNLTNQLEGIFGSLPKTLFFEYHTIEQLCEYFVESFSELLSERFTKVDKNKVEESKIKQHSFSNLKTNFRLNKGGVAKHPLRLESRQLNSSVQNISIIGLSGRYPEANNIEAYWQNLKKGKDCVKEIPSERWNWQDYYSEDRTQAAHHYSKWGGFIEGVDEFDPRFFNISPKEAVSIDPQERLFLQHAWIAMEDSGYTRDSLQIPREHEQSGQVGVYVGVMYGEYNLSGSLASIANRVSYVLNIHGPSMTLDTMCSSSLTAIHIACQDLKQHRTDLGIAGGVNVSIHPNKYQMLSSGQFISSTGQCQSFGEGGDGYIPGEGVGAVILKRLSEAVQDGDHIYAVVKGSSLNHGGKTNGYSVPNPQSQTDAIKQAIRESKLEPNHISYIEAHGTGTKLGDPIEIAALNKAFTSYYADKNLPKSELNNCVIGSAKSNIGHCESAAGIAGVTKVLLQMKHQQIVPSLHSNRLNPHIDFDKTPFEVNQSLKSWEQPKLEGKIIPRIAGISSFGAGGSNAHLILEEYIQPANSSKLESECIIPLSARNQEQLKQKAVDLLAFIQTEKAAIDLATVGYTLQVGREAMLYRAGFVVDSIEQLEEKLIAYSNDEQVIENCYQGNIKSEGDTLNLFTTDPDLQTTIEKWIMAGQYNKLLELWVKGLDLTWNNLYFGDTPQRISLPSYPFVKQKFWTQPIGISEKGKTELIHPLLHQNISQINSQMFSSIFSGNEVFVTKGANKEDNYLSLLTCLEMVLAAINQSVPTGETSKTIELVNCVLGERILLNGSDEIKIALLNKNEENIGFEIFSQHQANEEPLVEKIHSQGEVLFRDYDIPERINIDNLKVNSSQTNQQLANANLNIYSNQNELIVDIQLDEQNAREIDLFVLHPVILNSLASTATRLFNADADTDSQFQTMSLDSVKIFAKCQSSMTAVIRSSESDQHEAKIDIELMDRKGNICAQIKGMLFERLITETDNDSAVNKIQSVESWSSSDELLAEGNKKEPKQFAPYEVALPKLRQTQPQSVKVTRKPASVSLLATNNSIVTFAQKTIKTKPENVFLASAVKQSNIVGQDAPDSQVKLFNHGGGVFAVALNNNNDDTKLSIVLIEDLILILELLRNDTSIKALVFLGNNKHFLSGGRNEINSCIEQELFQRLVSFPYPTVAALQGKANGAGFLFASLCDFMFCAETSMYQFTDTKNKLFPSFIEQRIFQQRFGNCRASDFLYSSNVVSGEGMRDKKWSCHVVSEGDVVSFATKLAEKLSDKSQQSLKLLKLNLSKATIDLVEQLRTIELVSSEESSKGNVKDVISSADYIELVAPSDDVLVIKWLNTKKKYGVKALFNQLSKLFSQINQLRVYKVVVIESEHDNFIPESKSRVSDNVVLDFTKQLMSLSIPSIAVLNKNANGIGLFISQFFDICLYNKKGSYSLSELDQSQTILQQAADIFSIRHDKYFAQSLLLATGRLRGETLNQYDVSLLTGEPGELLPQATSIAQSWSNLSRQSLSDWKKENSENIIARITKPSSWLNEEEQTENDTEESFAGVSHDIPLKSNVISATVHQKNIVVIKMQDIDAKNMFSEAFVDGMREVFEHIANSQIYKSVILVGYDNYFSSGGTKDGLLAIQDGKAKFTDVKTYQLAMDCKVPVIAAMQGHGIGAGWALGMFADFVIFSKESRYVSPYMNYGFTPGAGSTYILPEKLGIELAKESLLTAIEFSGEELALRGIVYPCVNRKHVLPKAMELAKELARNSRSKLINLKQKLNLGIKDVLDDVYQHELDMHEKTFVGQQRTLEHIQQKFQGEQSSTKERHFKQSNVYTPVSTHNNESLESIVENLKVLLAQELHMHHDEIDESMQFVDLGLDSITGVTWVRLINEKYGLSIEATKVYNYPTLNQLASYVKGELNKTVEQVDVVANKKQNPIKNEIQPVKTKLINKNQNYVKTQQITEKLRQLLADELHLSADEIDDTTQFIDLGLDSITGVTWIRKINQYYKTAIEATKVYSYPTIEQLSRFVKEEAGQNDETTDTASEVNSASKSELRELEKKESKTIRLKAAYASAVKKLDSWRSITPNNNAPIEAPKGIVDPIAVIGMAGQFPQANDLQSFWDNIAEGKNCISQISNKRWNIQQYYQEGAATEGKTNSRWMGALEEYDLFDPLFFTISPIEAEAMDPQQRVFLQASWNSIEDAGYNADSLSGSRCGVFVGCAVGDYNLISREQQISAQGFTGGATSVLAARISYVLNLQGPCLSIDTACSSSLVAIANACDNLNSNNCDMALAGGVYVMAGPEMHIKTSQSGMLSHTGSCYTFDQRADGFVPGEGVGVVVLKRLKDAEKDRDIIQGVIQGWGVNQDGKTNGITAPNAESQTRLQQDIYDKFSIDPEEIQLIEAHGTGTKLGDPIEVEGLQQSFKKYTQEKNYCALGSIKSNIGHCLTAAAVAGFIKVMLAIKHKKLPPTVNFDKLNEHISLDNSPFFINTQLQEWRVKINEKRQAAISSFGFSGTNAHVVISEHKTANESEQGDFYKLNQTDFVIPLSAKTDKQLEQKISDLLTFIKANKNEEIGVAEIAYTLQVGRQEMEERLALIVNSLPQLEEKLTAYQQQNTDANGIFRGQVKKNKESMRIIGQDQEMKDLIVERWIKTGNLNKLLDLWVKGLTLDWNALYSHEKPNRISLPGYPFAKERYWIEPSKNYVTPVKTSASKNENKKLHPLLHRNASVLKEQGYVVHKSKQSIIIEQGDSKVVKRVCLPTYPFAKERVWIEKVTTAHDRNDSLDKEEPQLLINKQKSIEEIINKIDEDMIEASEAVSLLKDLA